MAVAERALKLPRMDTLKMLAELRAERARIEDLILAAERYARGQGKRRGRPPKWMNQPTKPESYKRANRESRRRKFSAETRRKMAASQKRRWATRAAQASA